jgi:uncharacterized protein (TIGR02588 family)
MNDTNDSSSQINQKPERSPVEWIAFGIGLFILTGIVGLVVYQWFTQKNRPPVLSMTSESEIRQASGQFYVPFSVTNIGGQTAESVQVIAELRIEGEVMEDGEQQIEFLAGGETEEGAFIFSRNPKEGKLVMRVASYKLP